VQITLNAPLDLGLVDAGQLQPTQIGSREIGGILFGAGGEPGFHLGQSQPDDGRVGNEVRRERAGSGRGRHQGTGGKEWNERAEHDT